VLITAIAQDQPGQLGLGKVLGRPGVDPSDTGPSPSLVPASVSASAARSRAVKKGVSARRTR
jgi:hypothetical protein